MHDMPRHQLIAVDENGDGPVPDKEAHHWACWCGTGRARIKFNGGNGLTLCPQSGRIIYKGFPPGWRPKA